MTLKTIVQQIATNVGLEPPVSAQDNEPDNVKMVQFVNETGCELIRRVDWSALTRRLQIDGLGTDTAYPLAPDHDRFGRGMTVSANGMPVRGGVSADEWFSLVQSEGVPRYFKVSGKTISLYPYPAAAQQIMVSYQSNGWVAPATGLNKEVMESDTDVALIPESLLIRGAVWRFLRHGGRDFGDHMAEFEAMLADLAESEGGVRQP